MSLILTAGHLLLFSRSMSHRHIPICLLIIFSCYEMRAQPPINFHHITVKNGLNDGVINAIARDKYGFMWFASLGALNKFNSTSVKKYTHIEGDSTSLPNNVPYAMAAGMDDRLWIGYTNGMIEFDILTGKCKKVKALVDRNIYAIHVTPDNKLFIGNHKGLTCYNPETDELEEIISSADTLSKLFVRQS